MRKVLIIKTGYSEFLEKENDSRIASYGDILRTTPLLHIYKDAHVTWVTDKEAFPLLENNPYITKLLAYDFTVAEQLKAEEFDVVVNLEKIPGICALADNIRARKARYGFTFNSQTGKAEAYDKAFEALAISATPELKKKNAKLFDELLFEMVGEKWKGEDIILGYKPKSVESYDVGLNVHVGKKWPTKMWPIEYWNRLNERLIKEGLKVTRQDSKENEEKGILKDLRVYMEWINSNRIIVTGDTLGLHLSIGLKKKVLGLFGPTPDREIDFHGRGKAILPSFIPECLPCFEGVCSIEKENKEMSCTKNISVERVLNEIRELIR